MCVLLRHQSLSIWEESSTSAMFNPLLAFLVHPKPKVSVCSSPALPESLRFTPNSRVLPRIVTQNVLACFSVCLTGQRWGRLLTGRSRRSSSSVLRSLGSPALAPGRPVPWPPSLFKPGSRRAWRTQSLRSPRLCTYSSFAATFCGAFLLPKQRFVQFFTCSRKRSSESQPVLTTDYRSDDGRFPLSPSRLTISFPDSLSSSETDIHPEIWSWKNHSSNLNEVDVRSHWWYLFYNEEKSWDSTTWFRIWQFQTLVQNRYLQKHLLAERLILWSWWSGFSERGRQVLSNGTNFAA